MSDPTPPVATKAPENDAAEDSIIAGDTPAQTGASMGEHCVTDRPTPEGLAPSGTLTKLKDIDVYVSKPSDYPHAPSKLLLLLTGGTGLASTNNKIQADRYSEEGFLVVMPDLFGGDPAPNSQNPPASENATIIEQVKLRAAETAKSFLIDMWLARHTPEKVMPIIHKVLEGAREEFADAVASGGGIYTVGYCFGAKYSLLLAAEQPTSTKKPVDEEVGETTTGPLVKTAAIAHGTLVTKEDFEGIKAPVLMICVENDQLFPDTVREQGEELMTAAGLDYKSVVYPGVPHGFAVIGDYEDAKIKEAQGRAFEEMLAFLKAH